MDDLTQIKGIGPTRAAELGGLGIVTFADLANAMTAVLVEQMEVSEKQILAWQETAGQLAQLEKLEKRNKPLPRRFIKQPKRTEHLVTHVRKGGE